MSLRDTTDEIANFRESRAEKLLVCKRAIIGSTIDQLKNISQIEHSHYRSPLYFVVHLVAGLIAYSNQDKKPGLHLDKRALLPV